MLSSISPGTPLPDSELAAELEEACRHTGALGRRRPSDHLVRVDHPASYSAAAVHMIFLALAAAPAMATIVSVVAVVAVVAFVAATTGHVSQVWCFASPAS